MTLEMRDGCGRRHGALARDGKKCICVFECTFCPGCAYALQRVCRECVGELVHQLRPQPVARGQVVA